MTYPKNFVDIDFETRSEIDIFSAGARVYAEDPSTEILMISFSIDQINIFNWNPFFPDKKSERMLRKAIRLVKSGKAIFRAHNSEFELWIWRYCGTRQFGWPAFDIHHFYDTMVLACAMGFPASLENAGLTIDAEQKKDKEGKTLINFFSKPSRKKDEKFKSPLDYKDKFFKFIEYCNQDVRSQIQIAKFCLPMSERQWEVFQLTEKMNDRGIPIDRKMCEGALALVDKYKALASQQIQEITGGKIESASQNVALVEWLNEKYPKLKIQNLQAATIEKLLNSKKTHPEVKKILKIRSNVSKSSTSKFKAALDRITDENKVHGALKAFIARTGRWGGRGLQIQNFSKPHKDFPGWCDYDLLSQCIAESDLFFIELIYDDVMEALKAATRSMIHAPKGYRFICADYSQIEARIVMWMANDQTGLNDFSGEGKIYENMASQIFDLPATKIAKPSFERDVGKETVLGCGFGMGSNKFIFRCVEQRNLPLDNATGEKAVKGYRKRYKKVPQAWKECEKAAIDAIENPGVTFAACEGKLLYKHYKGHLFVQLPSRRKLCYPFAKVELEEGMYGPQKVIYFMNWVNKAKVGENWQYERTWGGTLFQHTIQGTAMDIMANGMLNAEKRNYPALFTVHDESLALVKNGVGSVKEYEEILCELEPWAEGLPIVAEGWEGPRYKK